MANYADKRLNEGEIINKILEAFEENDDILEKTVEILKTVPHYTWVGIYLVQGEYLVLRHYIGRRTEHTSIKIGQGICGAAVLDEQTIIVPDVSADKRYIACSVETRSEIVVPIWSGGRIVGEIDIDSDLPCAFEAEDRKMLEKVADILGDALS